MPKTEYIAHWLSRVMCLIIVPLSVYIITFAIHFAILQNSGTGDANMPSLFQAKLRGTKIGRGPRDISYGSKITLKNYGMGGGLLHSHDHTYPTGSNQQQVTCYHHKDSNNDWIVMPTYELSEDIKNNYKTIHKNKNNTEIDGIDIVEDMALEDFFKNPIYIKDGDIIRLMHSTTNKNLHSHDINAPLTEEYKEVSCYGNKTYGSVFDYWKIEVYDDVLGLDKSRIHILSTRIKFKHLKTNCYLAAYRKNLPDWGWGQVETVCNPEDDRSDYIMWNVEDHENDNIKEKYDSRKMRSPFIKDFIYVNFAMWNTNNALIPDYDKIDDLASQPYDWPFMFKGLRMCGWEDHQYKYFMFGNPLVWWISSISIMIIIPLGLLYYLAKIERKEIAETENIIHEFYVAKTIFFGWALHYLPFYFMGRVMYLHHYFPALYFSIFASAFVFDKITKNSKIRKLVFVMVMVAIFSSFMFFAPTTYGFNKKSILLKNRSWLKSWKFYN